MAGTVVIEDSGTGLPAQQDRDWLDGANLMAAAHAGLDPGGLISGLGLTPDYGVPEVTVASGMVKLRAADVDTRDHGSGVTTWPDTTVTAFVDSETLALTDGDVNEIYVSVGLSSGPDDVQLQAVDSAGSAPASPRLKIGEVDASNDTVSEQWYRVAADGTLTFPNESAAQAAEPNLPEGTIVYDRARNTSFKVTA
jgi:hypothetical protein